MRKSFVYPAPSFWFIFSISSAGAFPHRYLRVPNAVAVSPSPSAMNVGVRFSTSHDGFQSTFDIDDLQSALCFAQCATRHSLPQYYMRTILVKPTTRRNPRKVVDANLNQSTSTASQRCVLGTRFFRSVIVVAVGATIDFGHVDSDGNKASFRESSN
jgi:hypothetical protein